MCLNVLRCMGVSTEEKGDSEMEEPARRHSPVEEAPARIYPSGNGAAQHYPPKSTTAAGYTHTAHHGIEQQHHEEGELQNEAKRAPATSDSSGERSRVKAKKEESRSEQYSPAGTNKITNYKEPPADQFNDHVVAGGQAGRGHCDGLRGAAAPAGTAATCADRYKTSDGRDAYGSSGAANSDSEEKSPVGAKVKESRSEHSAAGTNKTNYKEQGTGRRSQLNSTMADQGDVAAVKQHPWRAGFGIDQ